MILVRNRSVVVPTGGGFQYDASADGQHILVVASPEKTGPSEPRTLVPLRYSQINTFGRLLSNCRKSVYPTPARPAADMNGKSEIGRPRRKCTVLAAAVEIC
jgi:hypothetical protein